MKMVFGLIPPISAGIWVVSCNGGNGRASLPVNRRLLGPKTVFPSGSLYKSTCSVIDEPAVLGGHVTNKTEVLDGSELERIRSLLRYLTHEGYESARGERLIGNPDVVFPRKRIAIFVDGCFWHCCRQCRRYSGLSGGFWIDKIDANRRRDRRVTAELESVGWIVLRVRPPAPSTSAWRLARLPLKHRSVTFHLA